MSRSGEAVSKQHSSTDNVWGDPGPSEAGSAAGKGGPENVPEENRPGDDNQGGADAGEVDPVEGGSLENDSIESEPGDGPGPDPDNPQRQPCTLCLTPMGRRRPGDGNIETRMYLPCGHSYGHVCLFGQLFAQKFAICPVEQCALTLRHSCGHLAIPTFEKPIELVAGRSLEFLPTLCAYCLYGVGFRRRGIRIRRVEKLRLAVESIENSHILWKPYARLNHRSVYNWIWYTTKQLKVGHRIATLNVWDECQRIVNQGEAHVLGLLAAHELGPFALPGVHPRELHNVPVDYYWTAGEVERHAYTRRVRTWKKWDPLFWRTGNP